MNKHNNVNKPQKCPHDKRWHYPEGGMKCPMDGYFFHYTLGKLSELEAHLKQCPLNEPEKK